MKPEKAAGYCGTEREWVLPPRRILTVITEHDEQCSLQSRKGTVKATPISVVFVSWWQ